MYMFLKLMDILHTSFCIITHRVKRIFYKTYDTYIQNKILYHKNKDFTMVGVNNIFLENPSRINDSKANGENEVISLVY